jgi:hypothetical protein
MMRFGQAVALATACFVSVQRLSHETIDAPSTAAWGQVFAAARQTNPPFLWAAGAYTRIMQALNAVRIAFFALLAANLVLLLFAPTPPSDAYRIGRVVVAVGMIVCLAALVILERKQRE